MRNKIAVLFNNIVHILLETTRFDMLSIVTAKVNILSWITVEILVLAHLAISASYNSTKS